ncbi:MAG: ParB/Srx family N-terminal domain-containing protein [Bacteroidales bacterium]|nr:ParB/Srx family N-terminal domain-containing protein [Bacteroidales bacterium]
MKSKLTIDNDFTPCPESDGDEFFPNGIFVFNITKMTEHIMNNPELFVPEELAVKDLQKFLSINENHVDSVDISKPVIIAEIAPSRFNLIDGQHRVEKARRLGQEKIMAYRLTVHQHIRFLTSRKANEIYVEYWNSNIKEQ